MRLTLSIAATIGVLLLAAPGLAFGPCTDAGCLPSGNWCTLQSCTCDTQSCACTYYCDSNSDGAYDQRCTLTDTMDCKDILPVRPGGPPGVGV